MQVHTVRTAHTALSGRPALRLACAPFTCRPQAAGAAPQLQRRLATGCHGAKTETIARTEQSVASEGLAGEAAEQTTTEAGTIGSPSPPICDESARTLEWPSVCRQVACFCGTALAAERVLAGGLPMGRSPGESELLLEQTAEAAAAKLDLKGVYDLRPALQNARSGLVLNAKQLEGVAATLESAFALKAAATLPAISQSSSSSSSSSSGLSYPQLAKLAAGIAEQEAVTVNAIRQCIKAGSVVDEATEQLAQLRTERRDNLATLRAAMDEWARTLHAKGASEARSAALIRGRFCVGLKAGRQSELPKGSVKLGSSTSGATVYMEPAPVVALNNAEALLAEQEAAEELRVLALLSRMLAERADAVAGILEAVAALDVATARARHAAWLGATRPVFVSSTADPAAGQPLVSLPGARHPLLMEPALPPLSRPPSADDNAFDSDFMEMPDWERSRRGVLGSDDASSAPRRAAQLPQPLELTPPGGGTRVVAITGPNTGGKTVALKTTGLMALMAKAGLFLPVAAVAPPAAAAHDDYGTGFGQEEGGRAATSPSRGPPGPTLAWFDRVLADIGDSQSLQQSLSTFSGHIARIRAILGAANEGSLVLLDEVGSGTDPAEGAALARAILDRLAGQAALTLATTHHAELKRVSEEDGRYVNVSMEFDAASLRPTYRLCWGMAGASNALAIAQTLGFDSAVLAEALSIMRSAAQRAEDDVAHVSAVEGALQQQLEEAQEQHAAAVARRQQVEQELQRLQELYRQLKSFHRKLQASPLAIIQERNSHRRALSGALEQFAARQADAAAVESELARLEALIPDLVARYLGKSYTKEGDLKVGDSVYIPALGDWGQGTVRKVSGQHVFVDVWGAHLLGMLGTNKAMRVKKSEVRLVPQKGPSWGDISPDQARREEEYKELMQQVKTALSPTASRAESAGSRTVDAAEDIARDEEDEEDEGEETLVQRFAKAAVTAGENGGDSGSEEDLLASFGELLLEDEGDSAPA